MNLVEHVQAMPVRHELLNLDLTANDKHAVLRYREAGSGAGNTEPPLVLLHGIGSGSASWVYQLDVADASHSAHVLAWDAPGYADSSALPMAMPLAQDYAQRMWDWLDALGHMQVRIAGHSLGAIVAASAARLQPMRVSALTLLAPAQGYAKAPDHVRMQKTNERIATMMELGPVKMAEQRTKTLLAPSAHPDHYALTQYMGSRLHLAGYSQATQMLAHADISADLKTFRARSVAPVTVACGELDAVTPAKSCRALAQSLHVHYVSLGDVGHLCTLEASTAVNALLGIHPDDA